MQQGIKTIYMGEIDYNYLYAKENEGQWEELEERFFEEGFPKETLIELRSTNQAVAFAPSGEFPDNQKWFATGETLSHLDYALKRGKVGIKKKGETKYYFVCK